jgi:hypothetical protein
MCMHGYADHETQFSHSEIRTARKAHHCGECGRSISRGERYRVAAGKSYGEMWDAKVCVHCDVACSWLSENCNGYLYSAVHDDFREHADGNLAMLRIVVGSRRGWKSFADPARLLPVPAVPPQMNEHTPY